MRFKLHIPAYYTADGNVDPRVITMRLDHLPRKDEQIEVPNGGLVEVVNVRFRPLWTEDELSPLGKTHGVGYAYGESEPQVFTNWAHRPDDAPKTRSRTMRVIG